MNREAFEVNYASSHDLPLETFSQYRMGDTYRLPGIASHWRTWCAALGSDPGRADWQAECLKRGFEYVRESDDHYVLADVPEMAALLGQLIGVEVRDRGNDSYGETVSSLNEQIDAANNAFHRAYEAEKECDALRKDAERFRYIEQDADSGMRRIYGDDWIAVIDAGGVQS